MTKPKHFQLPKFNLRKASYHPLGVQVTSTSTMARIRDNTPTLKKLYDFLAELDARWKVR